MLRSIVLTFLALAVLVGAFCLYWRMQPAVVSSTPVKVGSVAPPPPSNVTQMQIGPGKRGWANTFDDMGRLASQFTAAEYTPQKDGTIKVDHPVNVFYLNDGQYIAVTGETGVVYVDSTAGSSAKSNVMRMGMDAPSRGLLKHVHVALFPSKQAAQPTLWMDVDNLSFDNDTLRLSTESYTDANGTIIAADRVPVKVRGNDYEFDGTGLTVSWNGRDHRLQLLEVAHGGRLEMKKGGMNATSNIQRSTSNAQGGAAGDMPLSESLAAADPKAAGLALPARAKAAQPGAASIPYRVVFHEAVRILQGDRQVALADAMTVDFLPQDHKGSSSAMTAPAVIADEAVAPMAAQQMANQGATQKLAQSSTHVPAPSPTATQSVNLPITIYWTGKLRITPLDSDPVMPIAAGQSAVRLVGSPVVLTPQGALIHAATVTYRNPDGAMQLDHSTAVPIVSVKQDRGMTFTTESMNYDPATSLATILGDSHLSLPLEGQREKLTAGWTDRGVLHLVGKPTDPGGVDHVDLFGNVKVDHPQFNLRSRELALDLEKTAAKMGEKSGVTLKRATAIGSAECRLVKPGQPDQGIDSDRLVLETGPGGDGKVMPKLVVAVGNVRAFDSQQELRAGYLTAHLRAVAASTKGAHEGVELESLLATTRVRSVLKSGAIADADQLKVNNVKGKSQIDLIGKPALVVDGKGGALSGPIIHISPDQSTVAVVGAGSMQSVRSMSPGEAARPMTVTWTNSMNVDGVKNTVDVLGHVKVATTDAIGTINTISGDKAHLDLMDAKGEKSIKTSATEPVMTDFGGKALKAMTLTGNVHGDSLLKAADGSVARHGQLWDCSALSYNAVSGRAEIPGAGQMLLEDHRKGNVDGGDLGGGRGIKGIRWGRSLVYDQTKRQVVITGDVAMGIKQDQKNAKPMDMRCQIMTIDLAASGTGATAGQMAERKMDVSHVKAEGRVDFRTKELHVTSHTMDYNPGTHLVTLRGTALEPGQVLDDAQGHAPQVFDELVWDAQAQEIKSVKGAHGAIRR